MSQNKFTVKDVVLVVLCTFLFTSGFMLLKTTFTREKVPIKSINQEVLPTPASRTTKKQNYSDLLENIEPDHPQARNAIKAKDIASIPRNAELDKFDGLLLETLQMEIPPAPPEATPIAEDPDEEFSIV